MDSAIQATRPNILGSSLFRVGGFGGPAPQAPRHFALCGLPAGGHNETSQLGWAKLIVVSSTDGAVLSETKLSYPPVFDGLPAANGTIYLSNMNGEIVSLAPAATE